MSDFGKTTVETYSTDKDGRTCAEVTSECARALSDKCASYDVVIHDADTGRIGVRMKHSLVSDNAVEVAAEFGYELDLISSTTIETLNGDLKRAVAFEFIPEVSDDE